MHLANELQASNIKTTGIDSSSLFYHHSDFIANELHFLLAQAGSGPHAGSITTGHERNWEIIAKFCCQGNKATLIILKH